MRNLIILLLPLASLATEYKPYPKCWEACSDEGYLYKITCPTSDTKEPGPGQMSRDIECDCTEPVANSPPQTIPCVPVDIPNWNPISSWKDCQGIAMDTTIDISYFRWQDNRDGSQSCYLLKDCIERPPCGGPIPDSFCVSGAKVCDEAPPTTPNCPQIKWDINAVHWVCTLLNGDPINAYGDTSPFETICQAEKVCPTWKAEESPYDEKVVSTCNASGEWEEDIEVKNAAGTVTISPTSGDCVCDCPELNINYDDLLAQSSTAFICDHDLVNNALTSDNSCVLICDGHITMIINCFDGKWVNTFVDSYPEVATADITCNPPVIYV